jgi:HEAT repeat protein
MKSTHFLTPALLMSFFISPLAADKPLTVEKNEAITIPDLTQTVDFERKGEYHLGPTGAKGWIYTSKNFMTTRARQILVTHVEKGSAADGVLEVGDVILGAGDKHFSADARISFGNAIDEAERKENGGVLQLSLWRAEKGASPRKGSETKVKLKLRVMDAYTDTAPWKCPKTKLILDDALKAIVKRKDFGKFGASALALLATGEQQYIDIVRDFIHEVKWAKPDIELSLENGGLVVWSYGYQNLLLTEYYLLTGDKYVLPAIREYSVKIAMGQSGGGTWGHGFAWTIVNDGKLHGALRGYGALNQAALPCFLSLILSKKCGIEHPEIDAAIKRSNGFFGEFVNNGSIGYGYHRPSLEIYASGRNGMSGNGKNGIAAVAFQVGGNAEASGFFSKLTASLYNTMEYGHSGNSYSYFWDPLGANAGGPHLTAGFLKKMRWYYALTRKADGSFVNQPLGGHYGKGLLDPTAAQVMISTMPRKAIYLTGKGQEGSTWLGKEKVAEVIDAGKWRRADTDAMSVDQLIGELDSWSPIAREWAAKALSKKEGDFIDQLIKLLKWENADARAGACAALGHLGDRSASAVPAIAKALTDDETTVCIAAGYALARIGKPAEQAIPDLLRAVIASNETESMRPKQQALAYSFGHVRGRTAPLYFNGLLAQIADKGNPLDGMDRELLYSGITKLLHDPSGRTRGCGAFAFQYFSREDTAAMAQEIYDGVKISSIGYKMFEDTPRSRGLALMARFSLKEGIPLCFETFGLKRWGSGSRVPARFETLRAYGGHAKPYLPQMREMRSKWKSGEHRDNLEETIRIIEMDDLSKRSPLISLHDLVDERFVKDTANAKSKMERVLLCRKLMEKNPDDYFYQAAGLRILVTDLGVGAFDDILISLSKPSEVLRDSAVALGATLPNETITQKWITALEASKGPQLVGVIDILATRKGATALSAIGKYLEHENDDVRAAATRALGASDTKKSDQ